MVAAAANRTTYLAMSSGNGRYALLTSANAINPILASYFAQYENLSAVSYLNTAMQKYYNGSKGNLSDCITETGTNPPSTNNFTNAISACTGIPHCGYGPLGLLGTFGVAPPYSVIGVALQNFSISYGVFNTSINSYFSAVQSINASNAGSKLSSLSPLVSNISLASNRLYRNALFMPPTNISAAMCTGSGLPVAQPWYCVQTGYCGALSFNSSLLGSISSTQQQLSSTIPSSAGIAAYSSASAKAASYYTLQANLRVNSASYTAFLNTTYPTYNQTVTEITSLLSRSYNANLSASLAQLKASFSAILSNGVNTSIASEGPGLQCDPVKRDRQVQCGQ